MIRIAALFFTAVTVSHLCLADPIPDPDPVHRTHVRIHVPYKVRTVHHHHVEKVPVIKEVPIIKEVPVVQPVPILKTVNTVHVPLIKTVAVEKPVFIPVKEHLSLWH